MSADPGSTARPGMKRPPARTTRPWLLAWTTAGLLAGQALGGLASQRSACALGIGALVLGTWRAAHPYVLRVATALAAAAVGVAQMQPVLHPRLPADHVAHFAGGAAEMRARIVEPPSRQPERVRFTAEIEAVRRGTDWIPTTGRALVTLRHATQRWRVGDRLQGALRLRRPRNFGNPGEFDYRALLARHGVYVTGSWADDNDWKRQPAAEWTVAGLLDRWRATVAAAIDAALNGPARDITAALIIGGADLDPAVRERYARTGLSHILSISGLHIALVAGGALAIGRWLLGRSERLLLRSNVPKLALAASSVPVVLYAGLAGASLPTLRSTVMGLLFVVATLANRQRHWVNSLAFAALGISVLWPGSACDISFQLSFMAVLAIVLGVRRIADRWTAWEESRLIRLRGRGWRAVRWGGLYLSVGVCAAAGTAPLAAWHFDRLSFIGIAANPMVVPLLGGVPVGLGLLAAVLAPLAPDLAAGLFTATGAVVRVADHLVSWMAAIPGAAVYVVRPSLIELGLLYAILAASLMRDRGRRRIMIAGCAALLALDAGWWGVERFLRRSLKVTFLSVGQGDSTVIEFPGSTVMVIDAGGFSPHFDTGERIVAPFLWSRKIATIDLLALSHPDFDHCGGLGFLVDTFSPRELWWNVPEGLGTQCAALRAALTTSQVPTIDAQHGFRRLIDGVLVRAIDPDAGDSRARNDRSLVLQLRYGPTTLLFPGDLEAGGETRLLSNARDTVASTVLKVPHHGSRTSSTTSLLRTVAPRLAIISVGHDNRFNLPDPSVLARYRAHHVDIFRTDNDGAIMLEITHDGTITLTRGVPAPVRVFTPESALTPQQPQE